MILENNETYWCHVTASMTSLACETKLIRKETHMYLINMIVINGKAVFLPLEGFLDCTRDMFLTSCKNINLSAYRFHNHLYTLKGFIKFLCRGSVGFFSWPF